MDISLPLEANIFTIRVAAIIKIGDLYLFDYNPKTNHYFLFGGRLKFGESFFTGLYHEVKEETGLSIESICLKAIVEKSFPLIKQTATEIKHICIFEVTVTPADLILSQTQHSWLTLAEIASLKVQPNHLYTIITDKNQSPKIYSEFSSLTPLQNDLAFELPDKLLTPPQELHIRVSSIIKTTKGYILDIGSHFAHHTLLIGGRLKFGESISQGLLREIEEELELPVLSYTFRGVGDDYFSMGALQVQFISYYFEVTIDETLLHPTKEAKIAITSLNKLLETEMNLTSAKAFIANNQITYASSIEKQLTTPID